MCPSPPDYGIPGFEPSPYISKMYSGEGWGPMTRRIPSHHVHVVGLSYCWNSKSIEPIAAWMVDSCWFTGNYIKSLNPNDPLVHGIFVTYSSTVSGAERDPRCPKMCTAGFKRRICSSNAMEPAMALLADEPLISDVGTTARYWDMCHCISLFQRSKVSIL